MTVVSLVVAIARNGVIGRKGKLPWHLPSELQRFKAITLGKPIIMGRKTWDGLPRKPLPGRMNIVVTRQSDFAAESANVAATAKDALAMAGSVPEVCIIGGAEIYAIFLPLARRIYLTEVDCEPIGDTYFPKLDPKEWSEVSSEAVAAGPKDSAGFTMRILER